MTELQGKKFLNLAGLQLFWNKVVNPKITTIQGAIEDLGEIVETKADADDVTGITTRLNKFNGGEDSIEKVIENIEAIAATAGVTSIKGSDGTEDLVKVAINGTETATDSGIYNGNIEINIDETALITKFGTIDNAIDGKASQAALNELSSTVAGKASQSDLEALGTTVDGKASQTALNELSNTVAGKATQSDLEALETTVTGLGTTVDGKAAQSDLDTANGKITAAEGKITSLEGTVETLSNTVDGKAAQSDLDTANGKITAAEGKITSLEVAVEALSSATDFIGVTTTELTDGATTNPIKIAEQDYTASKGDIVIYESKEFIWDSAKWIELGDTTALAQDVENLKTAVETNANGALSTSEVTTAFNAGWDAQAQ